MQLSFWEKPEPSLSVIQVVDRSGASYQIGRPLPVAGDPLSLSVSVRPLEPGIYIVSWRILSAVDGHATTGLYGFGVRVSPGETPAAATITYPAASRLEMLARWLFIWPGAAGSRRGGRCAIWRPASSWSDRRVADTAGGLLLLADAQRRNAATSFTQLLNTSIGRALIGRALTVAAAAVGLILARWSGPRQRRVALAGVAVAALAAMAVHVTAGHAAAGRWPPAATVGAQLLHFAAVGIWLGGLAALLAGVRGAPSATKTAALRRFSTIAAAGLLVVAGTGIVRAVNELSSWENLNSTLYGGLLLAKTALFLVIASFGAFNRWRSVPAAATSLRLLRRTASGELGLAAGALAATAILGTLPPPAASPPVEPRGLSASGSDFATSVRVELTTASDQPGPNRFVVRAVDYDSKAPVRADRVSLRFTPLDDPGVDSTSLALSPGPGDSYVGSGPNMAFDGRWRVSVLIESAGDSAEVPLELQARLTPRSVSVTRPPVQTPTYTVEMTNQGLTEFSPGSRARRSKQTVRELFRLHRRPPNDRLDGRDRRHR